MVKWFFCDNCDGYYIAKGLLSHCWRAQRVKNWRCRRCWASSRAPCGAPPSTPTWRRLCTRNWETKSDPVKKVSYPMVFILDGCSFYYTHIWSKSGISIRWRHLVSEKTYFTSYVRNVFWATILYKHHGFNKKVCCLYLIFIFRALFKLLKALLEWGVLCEY